MSALRNLVSYLLIEKLISKKTLLDVAKMSFTTLSDEVDEAVEEIVDVFDAAHPTEEYLESIAEGYYEYAEEMWSELQSIQKNHKLPTDPAFVAAYAFLKRYSTESIDFRDPAEVEKFKAHAIVLQEGHARLCGADVSMYAELTLGPG